MFSMLAILIYMAAMALPFWLLYHFGSEAWYWHLLAILGALALGVVPLPAALSTAEADLILGFVFVFLIIWGIGGLIVIRPHHEKHAWRRS